MIFSKKIVAASAIGIVSFGAQAGLSNFLVADAEGSIYRVDGDTLESTFLSQVNPAYSTNEIMYLGNNEILVDVTGQLVRHNLNTGTDTVVFDITDQLGNTGIHYTSGLAQTSSGDIFFSVDSIDQSGSATFGATFNLDTNIYTQLADIDPAPGLYFDHQEVGNSVFASADYNNQTISMIDAISGDTLASYNVGFGVVSFFENQGLMYAMGKEGGLYTFDSSNGSTQFVGQISGAGDSLIGASVPAPSALALLGLSGLATARRRR